MRSFALLVVLAITTAVLAVAPAGADTVPAGYSFTHEWFESHDGLQLHAGVFLPSDHEDGEVHPVILVPTPYTSPTGGATGLNFSGPEIRFPELFSHDSFLDDRYAYVQYDIRGFGGSEGCFQYYMNNEAADIETAVEYIHGLDWAGDVALWGKSYDAAQHVLALGRDEIDGLAATVIQAPGLSAYTALWQNGVHYATGRYATTSVYTADDLFPAHNMSTLGQTEYTMATLSPATTAANYPTCRTDGIVMMNTIADRTDPFWADKEPYRDAVGSDVPTFWIHGFQDANTKPTHNDIYSTLTGPTQAWFGQFTHVRGHESAVGRSEYFLDEAFRFLDRHVRGIDPGVDDAVVTVQQGDGDGAWRFEAQWPPADAADWTMPLNVGSYVDDQGNNAGGSSAGNGLLSVSPVLPHDVHHAGEIRVQGNLMTAAPGAHLVPLVYDIDPSGRATFVTRGAILLDELGLNEVDFLLNPQDYEFRAGNRIGVLLSPGDDSWYTPGATGLDVGVLEGTQVTFPLITGDRTDLVDGGPSNGMTQVNPFNFNSQRISDAEVTVDLPAEQHPAAD